MIDEYGNEVPDEGSGVGDFFANLVQTVSNQLPGIITGQPYTPSSPTGVQYTTGMNPPASPLSGLMPLLLIGGVAYLLLSKKR